MCVMGQHEKANNGNFYNKSILKFSQKQKPCDYKIQAEILPATSCASLIFYSPRQPKNDETGYKRSTKNHELQKRKHCCLRPNYARSISFR